MKKYTKIITVIGIVSMSTIQVNIVKAESSAKTEAIFSLEAQDETGGGTDPVLPVPPTGNKGPLTIDGVSSFVFPNAKISGNSLTIVGESAQVDSKVGTMGAQVTDSRGSGAGWTLKAKITDFTFKESPDESSNILTLKGAVFSLPQGEVTTSLGATEVASNEKPQSSAVSLNNENQKILVAKKGNGLGVWAVNFEKNLQGTAQKEVKLYVPAGNFKANYKATISWTLTEAPE
ncbi:MAG: WxL domain-containing protein [Carnobacterium sp.]|uniref:WxL domain-containing protein n=1 Tax=Carnobacterium sp. TaxID=48221 RepID=UPI002FCC2053